MRRSQCTSDSNTPRRLKSPWLETGVSGFYRLKDPESAIPVGCPVARHSVGCVYLICGPPVDERRRGSDRGKKSAYNAQDQEREARGAFRACAYALLGFRRVAAEIVFASAMRCKGPLAGRN